MPLILRQIRTFLTRSVPSLSSARTGGRTRTGDRSNNNKKAATATDAKPNPENGSVVGRSKLGSHVHTDSDPDPESGQSRQRTRFRRSSSVLSFSSTKPFTLSDSGLDPSIPLETETDPRLFSPRSHINLVQELSSNSASYQTWPDERAYIDVYGWNDKYTSYLNIIREMIRSDRKSGRSKLGGNQGRNSKPGLDPCIACCIQHGAYTLTYHKSIAKVAEIRARCDSSQPQQPENWNVILNLLDDFKVETGPAVKGRKVRVCAVPQDTKQLIANLADITGHTLSSLTHVCMQLVLCTQSEVYERDRKIMAEVVSHYLKTSHARAVAAEHLMKGLWK